MGANSCLKRRKRYYPGYLIATGEGFLIGTIVPAITVIGYLIIRYTGIWWLPILTALLVGLGVPVAHWIEKREREIYHMQVGHELYFSENPESLEKELKKARKQGISPEVLKTVAYYRARPAKVKQFTVIREKKRRVKAVLLYIGAVITAIVGISLLWRAFPFPDGMFRQKLKTADFTSIFLTIGGILVLISTAEMFFRKAFKVFRYAAAITVMLSAWSALIAFSIKKRPTYMDGLINGICLVVILLTTFVKPRIAGDIRTAEKVSRDKKELKISLYELGYIKEDELCELH